MVGRKLEQRRGDCKGVGAVARVECFDERGARERQPVEILRERRQRSVVGKGGRHEVRRGARGDTWLHGGGDGGRG